MISPIKPRFASKKANAPIVLGSAPVEIASDGATLVTEGTATLRLMPRDRVIIAARFPEIDGALSLRQAPLAMRFGEHGLHAPALALRMHFSDQGMKMDLLPQTGKLIQCADRRARLREAIFHVLNFPEFFCVGQGSTDFEFRRRSGRRSRLGRIVLVAEGWSIEIQALPSTSDLVEQLKQHGGSAITHVGRIARTDGGSFRIKAMEAQVHNLHRFLSFARGQYTGIFGVTGFDVDGGDAYQEWGMRLSTRWEPCLGWFDIHHGEALARVYPSFVSVLGDRDLRDAAAYALHWYLRSNRGGEGAGIDSGLLLSQAALERLAQAVLRKAALSTSGNAAERIRRALRHLGLPVAIPAHARRLLAGKRRQAWSDGPDAITKIRNELVHGEKRLSIQLSPTISDGWRLAQWYVELIFLRLCGYDGAYSNRLNPGWVGQVEPVPWAKTRARKAKP